MEYLFDAWRNLTFEIRTTQYLLLLSDFDGTLVPIASRPENVVLTSGMWNRLYTLVHKMAVSVGVISGRSLEELTTMVGIDGVYYAGNHGMEIKGPGIKFTNRPAAKSQSIIQDLANELWLELAGIDGVIVENKGLTLSVHYRLVKKEYLEEVAEVFRGIVAPLVQERKVKVTSGKMVWEVRPPTTWNKGNAAQSIIREIKTYQGVQQILTIYLGDDTTDEDAFKVVRPPDGISIYVGKDNPSSAAKYFLNSPSEVEQFLADLIKLK